MIEAIRSILLPPPARIFHVATRTSLVWREDLIDSFLRLCYYEDMVSLISTLVATAALAFTPQAGTQKPSILDSLKPFEGHWVGVFAMGTTKLDVDMTWKPFAGRWSEVSYVYSSGPVKLDYRVLMTPNAENNGFNLWMFGNDMPVPEQL